jgi:S-adenosyl-L-methionine hydrolase (adenosine-forming)
VSPSGILTFLTDFGVIDHYVAVMKAVALGRSPALTLVDITHAVPPQCIQRASFVLAEAAPWFPPGTVHVVVVDPGVGTDRRPLVARLDDQIVVAPDNGIVGLLWSRSRRRQAWTLEADLGLPERSSTFDGRDLFSPAGASLAAGLVAPEDCGASIEPLLGSQIAPRISDGLAIGRVQGVDRFGNLISDLRGLPSGLREVSIDDRAVPFVATYGDADAGALVALIGSSGWLEFACVQGDAAALLGAGVGAKVTVRF